MPRRLRATLKLKWKIGVYLGTDPGTNESYVGDFNDDVVKARGLVRVVADGLMQETRIWTRYTIRKCRTQ